MLSPAQMTGVKTHLREAVINTFSKQVGLAMEAQWGDGGELQVDCMSLMTLKTPEHVAVFSIGFPEKVLLDIIEKLLGEKHASLNAENADASGELMNIIYTSARILINQLGFSFQPAIPATVVGKNLLLSQSHTVEPATLFCFTPQGQFRVMVSIKAVKG